MTEPEHSPEKLAMLRFRRIRPGDECEACQGSGVHLYGSTSTWRGGIGGAAITRGVCNSCWGSGDRYRAWANLLELDQQHRDNVHEEALQILARRTGVWLGTCVDAIEEICRVLEDVSKPTKRKPRPPWFNETCSAVMNTLRDGLVAHRKKEQ